MHAVARPSPDSLIRRARGGDMSALGDLLALYRNYLKLAARRQGRKCARLTIKSYPPRQPHWQSQCTRSDRQCHPAEVDSVALRSKGRLARPSGRLREGTSSSPAARADFQHCAR